MDITFILQECTPSIGVEHQREEANEQDPYDSEKNSWAQN